MGIPPTVYWGDKREERLIPDGEGGFRVERERQFSELDIELLEAARIAEESISPRGIPIADELNPENQYRFMAGDNGAPRRNYAVAAQQKSEREYKAAFKDVENPDFDGLFWPVKLML